MSKQSCKSCAFWGNARPEGIKLPAMAAGMKETKR
jgi:hypothetical protein